MVTKATVSRSLWWVGLETVGSFTLSVAALLGYARLLAPAEFGLGTLAVTVVHLGSVLTGTLFYGAVVQRDMLEEQHRDSAVWVSFGLGLFIAGALWLLAAPLASWSEKPELASLLHWMSPAVIISGIEVVFLAELHRRLEFRRSAWRTLVGRGAGTTVGLALALNGGGAWALALQFLVTAFVGAGLVLTSVTRFPRLAVSPRHVASLLSFGWAHAVAAMISNSSFQIFTALSGLFLSAEGLGFFGLAARLVETFRALLGSAAGTVAFSLFSRQQNEPELLQNSYRQAAAFACLPTAPLFLMIAVGAEDIVHVLFGPAWAPVAFPVRASALMAVAYFGFFLAHHLISARGYPARLIALQVSVVACLAALVLVVQPTTVPTVSLIWVSQVFVVFPATVWLLRSTSGISAGQQVRGIVAPVVIACFAGMVMWLALHQLAEWNALARLMLAGGLGILVYLAIMAATNFSLIKRFFAFLLAGLQRT